MGLFLMENMQTQSDKLHICRPGSSRTPKNFFHRSKSIKKILTDQKDFFLCVWVTFLGDKNVASRSDFVYLPLENNSPLRPGGSGGSRLFKNFESFFVKITPKIFSV